MARTVCEYIETATLVIIQTPYHTWFAQPLEKPGNPWNFISALENPGIVWSDPGKP